MVTKTLAQPLKPAAYKAEKHPDWCPGCGDFGIVNVTQQALAAMQLPPWNTMFFSGVGCSGKTPHYFQVYGVHTLHGRVLPYAIGAKMANPHLTVIAAGGDGDGYGIGAGHFVHRPPQHRHDLHRVQQRGVRSHQGPSFAHVAEGDEAEIPAAAKHQPGAEPHRLGAGLRLHLHRPQLRV
jgi:hypothetical protein